METLKKHSSRYAWIIIVLSVFLVAAVELFEAERHWSVIPTGKNPVDQAISPNEELLVVLNAGDPSVSFIDLDTKIQFNKVKIPARDKDANQRILYKSIRFIDDGASILATSNSGHFCVINSVDHEVVETGQRAGRILLRNQGQSSAFYSMNKASTRLFSTDSDLGELPVFKCPTDEKIIDVHLHLGNGKSQNERISIATHNNALNILSFYQVNGSDFFSEKLGSYSIKKGEDLLGVSTKGKGLNCIWYKHEPGEIYISTHNELGQVVQTTPGLEYDPGKRILNSSDSASYIANLDKGEFSILYQVDEAEESSLVALDLLPGGFTGAEIQSLSAYPQQAESFAATIGTHDELFGVSNWAGAVVYDSSAQYSMGYGNNNNNCCVVPTITGPDCYCRWKNKQPNYDGFIVTPDPCEACGEDTIVEITQNPGGGWIAEELANCQWRIKPTATSQPGCVKYKAVHPTCGSSQEAKTSTIEATFISTSGRIKGYEDDFGNPRWQGDNYFLPVLFRTEECCEQIDAEIEVVNGFESLEFSDPMLECPTSLFNCGWSIAHLRVRPGINAEFGDKVKIHLKLKCDPNTIIDTFYVTFTEIARPRRGGANPPPPPPPPPPCCPPLNPSLVFDLSGGGGAPGDSQAEAYINYKMQGGFDDPCNPVEETGHKREATWCYLTSSGAWGGPEDQLRNLVIERAQCLLPAAVQPDGAFELVAHSEQEVEDITPLRVRQWRDHGHSFDGGQDSPAESSGEGTFIRLNLDQYTHLFNPLEGIDKAFGSSTQDPSEYGKLNYNVRISLDQAGEGQPGGRVAVTWRGGDINRHPQHSWSDLVDENQWGPDPKSPGYDRPDPYDLTSDAESTGQDKWQARIRAVMPESGHTYDGQNQVWEPSTESKMIVWEEIQYLYLEIFGLKASDDLENGDITLTVEFMTTDGDSLPDWTDPNAVIAKVDLPIIVTTPPQDERIALASKHDRVTLYGIPYGEASPTGEGESDAPEDSFSIDMFNLRPSANLADLSIPIEGNQLRLEVRRFGGVGSARRLINQQTPSFITYPTDNLMGLGWDTNIVARAIFAHQYQDCSEEGTLTVTDDTGSIMRFRYDKGVFSPIISGPADKGTLGATAFYDEGAQTILVSKPFGFQYLYKKHPNKFFPPTGDQSHWEEYFKISEIKDKNGNVVKYEYNESASWPERIFPTKIKELAHPERYIELDYIQVATQSSPEINPTAGDWGWRLNSITDSLTKSLAEPGEEIFTAKYHYTKVTVDATRPEWDQWLLTAIENTSEDNIHIDNDVNGDPVLGPWVPKLNYSYRTEVFMGPTTAGYQDQNVRIIEVGLSEYWLEDYDTNKPDQKTVFTYLPTATQDALVFPEAVYPQMVGMEQGTGPNGSNLGLYDFSTVELQERLSIKSVQFPGGMNGANVTTQFAQTQRGINCNDPNGCREGTIEVTTAVNSPNGTTNRFEYTGSVHLIDPLDTLGAWESDTGFSSVIHTVDRVTSDSSGDLGTITIKRSKDGYANITEVIDVNGNKIEYSYDSSSFTRMLGQPISQTRSDGTPTGEELITQYGYTFIFYQRPDGSFFNMPAILESIEDPEGKITSYTFDQDTGNQLTMLEESQNLDPNGGGRLITNIYDAPHGGENEDGFIFETRTRMADAYNPNLSDRVTQYRRAFDSNDLVYHYTVTTTVDPGGLNLKSEKTFDILGRLRKEVPPRGFATGANPDDFATLYEYNKHNQLIKITKPLVPYKDQGEFNPESEFTFDWRGDLTVERIQRAPIDPMTPGMDGDFTESRYEYDPMHRRIKATTLMENVANNIVTQTKYNNAGQVFQTIDGEGNTVSQYYDGFNRLKSIETPVDLNHNDIIDTGELLTEVYTYGENSGSGVFSYSGGWNPIRSQNRRGYFSDQVFDNFGRVIKSVQRNGNSPAEHDDPAQNAQGAFPAEPFTESKYNKVGNEVTHKSYFGNDNLTDHQVTYTFYDDFHRVTATIVDLDGDGADGVPYTPETTKVNDVLTPLGDAEDLVTRIQYNMADEVVRTIDAQGRQVFNAFDAAGRSVLVIGEKMQVEFNSNDWFHPVTRNELDEDGNITETWGPYEISEGDLNNALAAQSNSGLLTLLSSSPDGPYSKTTYDRLGRAIQIASDEDGDGDLGVDENGDPDGTDIFTQTEFDFYGSIIATIDPKGIRTESTYDKANRLLSTTFPAVHDEENGGGLVTPIAYFQYDKNSRTIQKTDTRGVISTFEYDEIGSEVKTTNAVGTPDSVQVEKYYDANGNLGEIHLDNVVDGNPDTQIISFNYDEFDRGITEIRPGGFVKLIEFRRDGKMTRVIDPELNSTEYSYDLGGRQNLILFKDKNGLISEARALKVNKAGNVEISADQITSTEYGQPGFPDFSQLPNRSEYVYDNHNRVLAETRHNSTQAAYTTNTLFDIVGRKKSIQYSTGRKVDYVYDNLNRLVEVKDDNNTPTALDDVEYHYKHDKNGNVTSLRWPTDDESLYVLETVSTWDNQNRLETRATRKRTDINNPLYEAEYYYDKVNNIKRHVESISGNPFTLTFNYDSQYRLKEELRSSGSSVEKYSYEYDLAGNRLQKKIESGTPLVEIEKIDYEYNSRNEIESLQKFINGVLSEQSTFDFDKNGNCSNKTILDPQNTELESIDYVWDESNRLIQVDKDVNGTITNLLTANYDGRSRRYTKTDDNAVQFYFLYDGGSISSETNSNNDLIEFVHGTDLGGGVGGILSQSKNGVFSHSSYNHLGHAVLEIDNAGQVNSWSRYESYGNQLEQSANSFSTNRLANTRELDLSTGLYNHGRRYYDPDIGRYLSLDPGGFVDGLNMYLYVNNNPANSFDPTGLGLWSWIVTGTWDPAPNVLEAAEKVIREDGFAGGVAYAAGKGMTETVAVIADAAIVVEHYVTTGEKMRADEFAEVAWSDQGAYKAHLVWEGEYSLTEDLKETGKAMATAPIQLGADARMAWENGSWFEAGEVTYGFAAMFFNPGGRGRGGATPGGRKPPGRKNNQNQTKNRNQRNKRDNDGSGSSNRGGNKVESGNSPNSVFSSNRVTFTATRPKGTGQTYQVIQRTDINWDHIRTAGDKRFIGKSNAEAARAGFAPQLNDGNFATLHHIGQDGKGTLAEASTRYHGVGKPGQNILHGQYGRHKPHPTNPINRRAFGVDTREYWRWRVPK